MNKQPKDDASHVLKDGQEKLDLITAKKGVTGEAKFGGTA